jgi:hypothetical protein
MDNLAFQVIVVSLLSAQLAMVALIYQAITKPKTQRRFIPLAQPPAPPVVRIGDIVPLPATRAHNGQPSPPSEAWRGAQPTAALGEVDEDAEATIVADKDKGPKR